MQAKWLYSNHNYNCVLFGLQLRGIVLKHSKTVGSNQMCHSFSIPSSKLTKISTSEVQLQVFGTFSGLLIRYM